MYLRFHVHGRCIPRLRGIAPRNSWKTSPSKKSGLDTWAVHYQTGEKFRRNILTKSRNHPISKPGTRSDRQLSFLAWSIWHGTRSPNLSPNLSWTSSNGDGQNGDHASCEGSALSPAFGHILPGDTLLDTMATNGQKYWMPMPFSLFKQNGIFDKLPPNRFPPQRAGKGRIRKPDDTLQALPGPRADC